MANITYWNAVGASWNRMKRVLFQPFSLEKWFVIGFAAWIAGLSVGAGAGGGGGGGGANNDIDMGGISGHEWNGPDFAAFWDSYGPVILLVGTLLVLLILAIAITSAWVHARGRFIFLDNLVYNRPAIVEPWKKYRKQGNSLFLWNLAIGLIGFLFFCILAVIFAISILPMIMHEGHKGPVMMGVFGIAVAFLLILAYSLVIGYLQLIVHDFVVPIMLKYDLRIREAWSRFRTILKPAFGYFLLYGLVIFLINILISLAIFAAVLASCCLLLLILIIPYIGTVALLPAHVFRRWIGIEFLRQFDENIDDIAPAADEEAGSPPPDRSAPAEQENEH